MSQEKLQWALRLILLILMLHIAFSNKQSFILLQEDIHIIQELIL